MLKRSLALAAVASCIGCVVPSDGCASYFPELHAAGLAMIRAQGGIFGWVTDSERILTALG